MTAHKHAKLIKAKADNMELVLFIKVGDKWQVTGCHDNQIINIASHYEYFLCLPKHEEACLHWLNNGEIELNSQYSDGWEEYEPIRYWSLGSVFMQGDYQLRIKPRKEKRHIYISTLGATTYAKKTKKEAAAEVSLMGGSFDVWKHYEIEIEVEV